MIDDDERRITPDTRYSFSPLETKFITIFMVLIFSVASWASVTLYDMTEKLASMQSNLAIAYSDTKLISGRISDLTSNIVELKTISNQMEIRSAERWRLVDEGLQRMRERITSLERKVDALEDKSK